MPTSSVARSAAEKGVRVLQRVGAVGEAPHQAGVVEVEQVDLVDLHHLAAGLAHGGLEVDQADDQRAVGELSRRLEAVELDLRQQDVEEAGRAGAAAARFTWQGTAIPDAVARLFSQRQRQLWGWAAMLRTVRRGAPGNPSGQRCAGSCSTRNAVTWLLMRHAFRMDS